ncbi:MAG: [citrate (pro-3S)-lyase] ligase [Bacillota bacterium]|jgi:[citrate (pro-3S)-lyase] ligase
MWGQEYTVQIAHDRDEVAAFLNEFALRYDFDSDITLVAKSGDRLLATGSLRGDVLQCFAVDPEYRGLGLSAAIVDRLVNEAFDRKHTRLFVFTSPDNIDVFQGMGFRLLAETHLAALLEIGTPTVDDYVKYLELHAVETDIPVGGLVMNCNPFTLGHQYLVEKASRSCEHVYVLVVEEDQSVFPSAVRVDLVKRGTMHLDNVTVLSSGRYSVSLATFPSYFTSEETAHAEAGAGIDATLYCRYVTKALGITHRFVGSEPFSPVTAIYNATMRDVFAQHGIKLVEIPRLKIDGATVSASRAREALRLGDYHKLSRLLPGTTLDFLRSPQAGGIVAELRTHRGRH